MHGETFYGRHTAQHQLQWRQIKIKNQAQVFALLLTAYAICEFFPWIT